MNIPNPHAVVIPPVEEKTYPDSWVYNLNVHCPTTTSGAIKIELLPYNYTTKELLGNGAPETLSLNLWEAMPELPELQQIFGMIIYSIPVLRDYVNKTGRFTPVVEEPIVEEPIVEEPIVEEPPVEEPIVEEPPVEEPLP